MSEKNTVKPGNNQNQEDEKTQKRPERIIMMAKIAPFVIFTIGAIILWSVFNKFIAIGFLGLTAGSFFLQGLRRVPADPPHKGVITILGKREPIVVDEGWWFFPFFPLLVGFVLQKMVKINIDLTENDAQEVWTPDNGRALVSVSITITPDKINLIEWFNSGGKQGVTDILKDIVRQALREWARSKEEGPQTLEEALGAQEEAVLILLKSIVGEAIEPIPSSIPTTILIKFFEAKCKPSFPQLSISEERRYKKEGKETWDEIQWIIREECNIQAGGAFSGAEFEALKTAVEKRRKDMKKVSQGNGTMDCPALGCILNRLNVGKIEPTEVQAKAMELLVKEERERAAETIELDHIEERIKKLVNMGFSLGEARETVQTERGKVEKKIQENKHSISQETIKGLTGLFGGKE